MISRLSICVALVLTLGGCANEEAKKKKEAAATAKAKGEMLKDQVGDPALKAFLGRLRLAAANHDTVTLGSMMTPDFGYRWDNPPVGDNVFTYWDMNNTWTALIGVLRENFVPNDRYMVAPPAVVSDPNYRGYRAGLRLINGAWRFAYFVPDEAAGQ